MLTTLQASFQFAVPTTSLPRMIVTTHPVGLPTYTYTPVSISVPGLKQGDTVSSITVSPDANKYYIVGINDNQLIIQSTSNTLDQVVSGNISISRNVDPLKSYSTATDVDGYVVVSHGLNRNPDKWLATSSVGPNQEPVVLNFVSSDTNNLTLRAFSNNSPLVSSSIKISLLLN